MSMDEVKINLSKELRNNAESLIVNYASACKELKHTVDTFEERLIAERFTLALNGMLMLMNDEDRQYVINVVEENKVECIIKKAIKRIKKKDVLDYSF